MTRLFPKATCNTHLILHKVRKDVTVKLSNVVDHNGKIDTLHLDFGLASSCCWVLLLTSCSLLNLETREHNEAFLDFQTWGHLAKIIIYFFLD